MSEDLNPEPIIDGVVAWVRDVLPEIGEDSAYDYVPEGKAGALPDVVAEVGRIRMATNDPAFPFSSIQQRYITIYEVALSIMVDNDDSKAAAATLRDFARRLGASLMRSGGNLGGRVPFVSPFFTFDFTRPFVRYQDGTKGREVTMDMSIGQLVEVPS